MSEHLPILPYASTYVSEWCDDRGIDDSAYPNLRWTGFLIAGSQRKEVSARSKLRQHIEDSLPLSDCERVDDPTVKAGEPGAPKVFLAPDGQAFELTTTYSYRDEDEWGDPSGLMQESSRTFVGEYLSIETYSRQGSPYGLLCVRERPVFHALPILGGFRASDTIRLPSRADPDNDGAHVSFVRLDGWDVVRSGNKLEGEYESSSVRLVPYDRPVDNELYVADFGRYNDFALDEFEYSEEELELPLGFSYLLQRDGSVRLVENKVNTLTLPYIDQDDWSLLWYDHDIMIKWNPTIHMPRSIQLDFSEETRIGSQIAKFNCAQKEGKTLLRILAVRSIGRRSLQDIVEIVTGSTASFSVEEEKDIEF